MPQVPYKGTIYGDESLVARRGLVETRISIGDMQGFSTSLRHPGYTPGRIYPLGDHGSTVPTAVAVATTVSYAYPFVLEEPISVSNFAVNMTTAVTSTTFKAAIYSTGRSTVALPAPRWVPFTPVVVSNTATAAATAAAFTANPTNLVGTTTTGAPTLLNPGLYWAMTRFSTAGVPSTVPPSIELTKFLGGSTAAIGLNTQVKGFSVATTFANDWAAFTASTAWTEITGAGAMPLLGVTAAAPAGY